ncbi:Hypothetical predicted protein [Paramuricea clavata]|uniref:Uncharacterized protein n=1 Tax=Paramuricea clavata TaxID=317549 RepID=A0A7D9E4P1_PARCT|nr:Hypothetical predicted protein [Paramuricea clavata]
MSVVCINQFYVLCVVVGVSLTNILAADSQCAIPDTGKTGSKNSVVLSLYRCSQATPSKEPVCLTMPSSQDLLEQGKVVDLKHDVNDYAVTAKFFGDEVCVAYREISSIRSYRNGYKYNRTNECTSECFKDSESETYETELICNPRRCSGGWKKFRFVVVTESGSESTVMSFLVLTICGVLSFGFAS